MSLDCDVRSCARLLVRADSRRAINLEAQLVSRRRPINLKAQKSPTVINPQLSTQSLTGKSRSKSMHTRQEGFPAACQGLTRDTTQPPPSRPHPPHRQNMMSDYFQNSQVHTKYHEAKPFSARYRIPLRAVASYRTLSQVYIITSSGVSM